MNAETLLLVKDRTPKALAADKVSGDGCFALLSCPEADGVRRVCCYWNKHTRARMLEKWERHGSCASGDGCTGDHVLLDLVRP